VPLPPHIRPRIRRIVPAALLAAGVMAGAGLAAPAAGALTHPAGHHQASGVIGGFAHVWSRQRTLAYWTPARMRAARPAGLIDAGAGLAGDLPLGQPTGKPESAPGGLPHGRGSAAVYRGLAITRRGVHPSYVFTMSNVPAADYMKYPWSMNGILFFSNGAYQGDSCSATVVGSYAGGSNEDEIWTAGHCLVNTLSNNQVLDSTAMFVPGYNGNASGSNVYPFGEFTWNGGWYTTTAWYLHRDPTEDEAAMTFGTSSTTGRSLGSAVGYAGFAWNYPVQENFTSFAYPVLSPYNGFSMIEDVAATAGQAGISGGANPVEPILIGSTMTDGASGGAWYIDWTTSSAGFVDGHYDFPNPDNADSWYSPYQDSTSNMIRCFGASNC
jgi:hypothetical protein